MVSVLGHTLTCISFFSKPHYLLLYSFNRPPDVLLLNPTSVSYVRFTFLCHHTSIKLLFVCCVLPVVFQKFVTHYSFMFSKHLHSLGTLLSCPCYSVVLPILTNPCLQTLPSHLLSPALPIWRGQLSRKPNKWLRMYNTWCVTALKDYSRGQLRARPRFRKAKGDIWLCKVWGRNEEQEYVIK